MMKYNIPDVCREQLLIRQHLDGGQQVAVSVSLPVWRRPSQQGPRQGQATLAGALHARPHRPHLALHTHQPARYI